MQYRKITVRNKELKSSHDSLLSELLALKNITTKEQQEKFLNPKKEDFISPYAFCDMKKAVDRINYAIENNQTILIWGDFDCDGVTSTSILYKALKELNAQVIKFIPDRILHGHGLNSTELIKLISKEKVKLVITVDCGSSNIAQVNLLNGLKVDTIITDHHSIDTELPNAFAIINPQVKNSIFDSYSIENITSMSYNSGSIIAYKLAMALLENNNNLSLKEELLLIASCGAIADVVPLLGENRAMVSIALNLLNQKGYQLNKGIYKLLSKDNNNITSYDIAFNLAPRINAVGRLANAQLSFDFLTTDNDLKLDGIIEQLNNYNQIRQAKCQETYENIIAYLKSNKDELNNPAIILMNKDWHIGVIGIVASKIVEEYNKPCFLMTQDEANNARCSIRSNDLINVYDVLKENQDLFLGFGGHALAGGCSFDLSKIDFEKVKNSLIKTIEETKNEENSQNILVADYEINPNEINFELIENINKLEPFGQNNEQPIFVMRNVLIDEIKYIGKEANHLSLNVIKDNVKYRCLKWQETDFQIPPKTKCDIAFYLKKNEFNGEKSIQFELIDVFSEDFKAKTHETTLEIFDHRQKRGILEQICQYVSKDKANNIGIWAKLKNTKNILSKHSEIKTRFLQDFCAKKVLMFFDYPSNKEEFSTILNEIKPIRIHFMNNRINENLEEYISQITGMIKFCHKELQGNMDIKRLSLALGTSEAFVQLALEILEDIGAIKIYSETKVEFIKPFSYEEFKNSPMFEVLTDEFNKIIEYKNYLLNCPNDILEDVTKTALNQEC